MRTLVRKWAVVLVILAVLTMSRIYDIAYWLERYGLVYRARECERTYLTGTAITVVVAILYDAIDLLGLMITKIKTGNSKVLKQLNTEAFGTRLKWLSNKFKDIDRASCSIEKDSKELDQESIDQLMQNLGL